MARRCSIRREQSPPAGIQRSMGVLCRKERRRAGQVVGQRLTQRGSQSPYQPAEGKLPERRLSACFSLHEDEEDPHRTRLPLISSAPSPPQFASAEAGMQRPAADPYGHGSTAVEGGEIGEAAVSGVVVLHHVNAASGTPTWPGHAVSVELRRRAVCAGYSATGRQWRIFCAKRCLPQPQQTPASRVTPTPYVPRWPPRSHRPASPSRHPSTLHKPRLQALCSTQIPSGPSPNPQRTPGPSCACILSIRIPIRMQQETSRPPL